MLRIDKKCDICENQSYIATKKICKSHIICYSCSVLCDQCDKYHCNICIRNNELCELCLESYCIVDNCNNCNKKMCIACVKRKIDECNNCGKCWNIHAYCYENNYCYNCAYLEKPICDICNLRKCPCMIHTVKISYDDINLTKTFKMCTTCETNPITKTRGKYLLVTVPAHKKIDKFYYNDKCIYQDIININKILMTLLLIANTKNKYISKNCFIHKLMPFIIVTIYNKNQQENMLYI